MRSFISDLKGFWSISKDDNKKTDIITDKDLKNALETVDTREKIYNNALAMDFEDSLKSRKRKSNNSISTHKVQTRDNRLNVRNQNVDKTQDNELDNRL